jgi:hypothetical protein
MNNNFSVYTERLVMSILTPIPKTKIQINYLQRYIYTTSVYPSHK